MQLDHVSYAVSHDELADTVQRLGAAIGTPFIDGGKHPRFGTSNFVLPLAGHSYIEVVAALEHPAADRAPFGRAVKQRAEQGGGWLGWVIAVDDIAPLESRLGRESVDGNRHRPDGVELRWKQIGISDTMADPQLPFFVQWLVSEAEHPSAPARADIQIAALDISGDAAEVDDWLGVPYTNALDGVTVNWVNEADEHGLCAVHVHTPNGTVRLD